jgi:glutathione S-transferase
MKLIASTTSPFARKVRIVLAEKDISCDFVVDVPWSAETEVPKLNPLGKVPVLVLDDGDTLYDSRVIVEYLEQLKPWPMLIPADAKDMIAVKKWEALADGISDAAATIFLEHKRPAEQQSMDWIARQQRKIDNGLATMNTAITDEFCVRSTFSLADIAVGSCLGYLDLRFAELSWRERFSALATLENKLAERTSFKVTALVV